MTKIATGAQHEAALTAGRDILERVEQIVAAHMPAGASDADLLFNRAVAVACAVFMAADADGDAGLAPRAIEGLAVGIGRYMGQQEPVLAGICAHLMERGLNRGIGEATAFLAKAGRA